ncbi:hypothetical protein QT792_20265 [Xanthomonas citri pv. citri]|uniref:hypothetical protein n=1 Tax=Xanthomonas TaxID=338 RepID=UPI0002C1005F|nr:MULTISPECIES: hypothetical protein [Xanthomonas]AJY87764.1 hypothetical protein J158_03396 [Xanthomonas citri subsp. citri UI6]AGH78716.1 hypothetical protein XAC29_16465 [Xanthomonas axonopodis Xac29-1]AJD69826.1 hypothetical protein J151_03417 [Xanthomonas citri subsp. citri A306]AJY83338.1 hypothetical protein J159_03392 [Xanthomonas citri pv. citri]AJY92207.1 hypothetical protein J169_03415 [Xanthomonas citri pv. citri]
MRKTLDDLLREWSGQQPERKTPWRALRGRLWLDHALWLSGLEWTQFERICIQRNRSASKLGGKWRAGTNLPNRSSAQAMERVLSGTAWVFDLALFQLLSNEPLTRSRLTALTANFRQPGFLDGHCWRLPHQDGVAISHDSQTLLHRGDLWGLFGLVGDVRWAELEGDDYKHLECSQDAFRALPALLRTPWAAACVPQLYELLERVRRRVPYTRDAYEVEWKTIEELAARAQFSAEPADRSSDANGYAELYPDPIVLMKRVRDRRIRQW